MPLPNLRFAALFAPVLLLVAAVAVAEPLQAPYQVDEILIDPRRDLSHGERRSLPLIDLDPLRSPAQADVDRWVEATVLTEYGPAPANLIEIRKSCKFLCGVDVEELYETCHYQAVLEPKIEVYDLGNMWAAFPGSVEVTDYEMLERMPLYSVPRWSPEFYAPLWSDEARRIRVDGWTPHARRLQVTVQTAGVEHAIDQRGCRASPAAGLTLIACHGTALIAADGVPLLLSGTGDTLATAAPVAKFTHDGELYVLVRLGLEFQTVYGLLVRRGDRWVLLFRKIERALVC